MPRLIFHPQVANDLRSIRVRYAKISEPTLSRFNRELSRALAKIEAHPEHHHFDSSGYRRSNLKRFPYHILFESSKSNTNILVLRHHHRAPDYGLDRPL